MPVIDVPESRKSLCRHISSQKPTDSARWQWGPAKLRELSVVGRLLAQPTLSSLALKETKRYYDISENERLFNSLAEQWRAEAGHMSSMSTLVSHPSYLQIIGMGRGAVPMLLRRLKHQPDFWFPALAAITREDPIRADDAGNMRRMTKAWLDWGSERGLI